MARTDAHDAGRSRSGFFCCNLVNNTVDARPVSSFLPVHNIEFEIRTNSAHVAVKTLRENGSLESVSVDGWCRLTLSELKLYEVVEIRLTGDVAE